MGRAERRRMERKNRIEERKDKILMTHKDINNLKKKIIDDVADFKIEVLMTCFALANRRLYGHGATRIMRSLNYIDELMGSVLDGAVTIEDYKKELEDEAGVVIKCR